MSKIAILFIISFCSLSSYIFAEEGKAIYRLYCSQCHGLSGNGKGINSAALQNNPQNHTDASYMSSRTDAQLEEVIRSGGIGVSKSPIMPSWKGIFSDKEIKSLVHYLRELCSCKYDSILSNKKLRNIDPNFR